MARSTGKSAGRGKAKSNFTDGYKFINVHISAEEKKRMGTADLAVEFPLDRILALVEEGYKFSVKEDTKNDTFVSSLTDGRPESVTFKTIVTGRGSTAINSWYAVAFKHFIVMGMDWSSHVPTDGAFDFD